jgi:hypothetical protein
MLTAAGAAAPSGASGSTGRPSGLDGAVNQYIQDRVRDSSAAVAQQIKQELTSQVRRNAEVQLRQNGGKIVVYAGVAVAALIVLSAVVGFVMHLFASLLPFAIVILLAYFGYLTLRGRRRRY